MGVVHCPEDWDRLARDTLVRCNDLVGQVIRSPPSARTISLLDDISDTLCQVLDSAEFCRNVHTEVAWRDAATSACVHLGSYVQALNTHADMYGVLAVALHALGPHGAAPETLEVGRSLARDFQRYGVHLDARGQESMAQLTAQVQGLGYHLGQNLVDPAALKGFTVPASLQGSLPAGVRPEQLGATRGKAFVPADDATLGSILAGCSSPEIRRRAYLAQQRQPVENLDLLDRLASARRETAALMGFSSYAAYQLSDFSLAATPEAVAAFLEDLGARLAPAAAREARTLQGVRAGISQTGARAYAVDQPLDPWDVLYLKSVAKARMGDDDAAAARALSCTPEQAVRGLDALMRQLMGVRVRHEDMVPGEGWAPGLVKLAVSDADGTALGCVYLDFQPRPGKFSGAAHFVLRCGRGHGTDAIQTPILALVANVPAGQPMHPSQLELLLHEWGHALHTLLSRTRHQHLSGTRGPLDLMEVPSHVFEHYARDEQGLALLLGRPAARLAPAVHVQEARRRAFPALSMLHQLRFGHLVGYGATYYSYLTAQSLSARLWRRDLARDPVGPEAGAALRERLLAPGGALPARDSVALLFADDTGAVRQLGQGAVPEPGELLEELGIEG